MAVHRLAWEHVDFDIDRLSRAHIAELGSL